MTGRRADRIVVAAAVVEREGLFLLTRRLAGTHLAGTWEFPGGKCEPGESPGACLRREMREELGVEIDVRDTMLVTHHDYPERSVELHFFRAAITGEPRPLLGQDMRWIARADLESLDFPEADAELIRRLAAGE